MLNRKLLAVILLMAIIPAISSAADRYVRPGATGSNTGSDWANAYTSLPSTLVRGDTYYLAAGSYGSYTFNDPQSGTALITIKKATAADHGTNAGWSPAYGTGQAIFNSTLRFETGNYVLDGQTRNEADWFDGASYGIRVNHNGRDQNIVISGGSNSSNIAIKHVFIDAIEGNLPADRTIRRYAIDTDTYGGSIATGLVFHRMYVNGSNNVWFLRTTNGAIVEYSASSNVTGNAANHGEIVNLFYSGNNAVVRYNQFKDAYLNGGGTALVAITFADGLQFYGNVLSNFQVGDGAVGFNGYYSSHNRVYNNTIVNGTGACGTAWGSGTDNLVYNNLFINCRRLGLEGAHDYNGFSDSNARGEANAQVNVPTSIFANYAGGDFRLARGTSPGMSLGAPFNVDLRGASRGGDGAWDRGAFEFGSDVTIPPVEPPVTPPETPPSANGVTVFTTQTPELLNNSDGTNVNYELGMRFKASEAGQIRAIRFYKSSSESGAHTGKIYSADGQLLASVLFANETASGWQEQALDTPLMIEAGSEYVVSVNTGDTYYVATNNGLDAPAVNGPLQSAEGDNGVYGPVGAMPTQSWRNSNYFRDVVFAPADSGQSLLADQAPVQTNNSIGVHFELGMRFLTTEPGQIKAIRFYKAPGEQGAVHTGKIYRSDRDGPMLLATVTFQNETASGWQEQALDEPLSINAGTEYIVAVNTGNTYYVATMQGLGTPITSGNLRSMDGPNGIYREQGTYGWRSWENLNYFRDVVFVPAQ